MLASHNGYHSESATSRTASVFMPSCSNSKSKAEYGASPRRPSEPVATIAKPLPGKMPISEAFVVSQNSCSSPHASRRAAESSSFGPRASNFSRAAAKSLAAPGVLPAPAGDDESGDSCSPCLIPVRIGSATPKEYSQREYQI